MKIGRKRLGTTRSNRDTYPLNLFRKIGPVSIERAYNGIYRLLQPLGSGDLYWEQNFSGVYTVGGEWMRRSSSTISKIFAGFAIDDASTTKTGTWSTNTASTYITGRWSYTGTSGAYIQYVTDDEVTEVGLVGFGGGNGGGLVLVTIDGDNTMANLLQTAQDYVDAETFPNTILVENGGSLNPTDRVFNQNVGNSIRFFSRTLTAGSHTIKMTNTGYKTAGSANFAMFFSAFIAYGQGKYGPEQTYRYMDTHQIQHVSASDEISWFFKPTGATNGAWLGHTGRAAIKTLPIIMVDGVDRSDALLTNNTLFTGNKITITTQNNIRHPEFGTTSQGVFDLIYTMSPKGLDIYHKETWGVSGTIGGFPCMLTVSETVFDRCANKDGTVNLVQSGTNKAYTSDNKIWAFDSDGNQAKIMTILDMGKTVNHWLETDEGHRLYWLDQSGVEKAYAQRIPVASPINFTNTTVYESLTNYRTAWFPNGTNELNYI